jgi:tetratricopeptide (TPR) repeat protein
MKIVAFVLSTLLPGLGQILLSRYRKGLIIFFSLIILLDLSLIILPCLYGWQNSKQIRIVIITLVVFIYLYSLWDIFNIVYWRERDSVQNKKRVLLKQGIVYYLQNDLDNAKKEFLEALRLDKDDIDILYYLSKTEGALGKIAHKKRLLNKLSQLDFTNKWKSPSL